MQLWWEKLQQSGIVGAARGSMGAGEGGSARMGGAGAGYHHVAPKAEEHGLVFPSGAPPARMAPSHSVPAVYGQVNVKSELPQTDGADSGDMEAGVAASRPSRRPRRGQVVQVEVAIGGGEGGGGLGRVLNVEQLDGAGAGPAKRKRDGEEDEDDLGVDDDDDDDPLNSDDDDDEDNEDAMQTNNLVLCQYDKVSRTKNKWKAQLKFGVMTLESDGRKQDFIFNKGSADMNFAN